MHRLFFAVIASLFIQVAFSKGVQDWNFMLRKLEQNSSNHDMVNINLRTTRKEPGIYAINGTAVLHVEIDDRFSIEINVYRSPSGSGQYKLTPYYIKRQKLCDFVKSSYIPLLQKDLEVCSNLPILDEGCETHITEGVYYFNMCLITSTAMLLHIQPGHYKIVAQINSEDLDVWISLYTEVQSKSII